MPNTENLDELIDVKGFVTFQIKKSEIIGWLETVYTLTGIPNLEHAIGVAKHEAKTKEEKEIVDTVALLYKAQCGGALIPPVSIKIIYSRLYSKKKETKQ